MQSPPTRGANGAAARQTEASEAPPANHMSSGGLSGTDSEGSGSMRSSSTVPAKTGKEEHAADGRERDADRIRGGLASGSVLGKRDEPEAETSSGSSGAADMKEHIMRLSRDNKQLKSALSKSQEEVKKLKSVIEMHELQSKKSSKEDSKATTRYWTDAEHQRFLDALQAHGPKDVKAIAQHVGTRSATQVRTHAQKYFIKLARMKKSAEEAAKAGVPASAHGAWWLQGHNPSAAPTCKGDADEREEDMEEIESASIATLANMGSFKSDRDKSQLMASSIEKAQEEMSSLRTRMDHMGDSFQSAPYAVSSRRSGGGDGLSAGGGGSSAKGMSSSTQKGRERVERGERAERVQRVGRDWQGVGAGAGAAGSGEGVGGKALGKTLCSTSLTSSSNEESGITDGSSTHGNGTSNGSWLESGSDKPSSEPSCPDTESSKHPSTTNSEGDSNNASNNGSDPSNNGSGSDGANNSDGCSEASGDRWEGEEEAGVEAPRGATDKKGAGAEEEGKGRRGGESGGGGGGGSRKGGVAITNLVA